MQAGDKYDVYIIDPDSAIRDSAEYLLDSTFVDVHGFEDADAFLREQKSEGSEGCLLVESTLPDSNGLSLIAKLRAAGNHIPALLLTSSTDTSLAERAAVMGFSGVVRKPLNSQQLLEQIRKTRKSRESR